MTITQNKSGKTLEVLLEGRLDTLTAPELEKALSSLEGVEHLVLDLEKVDYVSSAGLRVMLAAHKRMSLQGDMCLRGVQPLVREVLDMSGLSSVLTLS